MNIVQYMVGQRVEAAILVTVRNEPGHRLHGHMLINYPPDKPHEKREAKWLDPKTVQVIWIREFMDPT